MGSRDTIFDMDWDAGGAQAVQAFGAELLSQDVVLGVLAPLYQSIGGKASDHLTAAGSLRSDSACTVPTVPTTWVTRTDLNARNMHRLIEALKSFRSCRLFLRSYTERKRSRLLTISLKAGGTLISIISRHWT